MVKLQSITRPNGTTVFFFYLPEDLVREVKWQKGDDLQIYTITQPATGDLYIEVSKCE